MYVLESSSVLVSDIQPPMRIVPTGDCQDTWSHRPSVREWDSSHSPLKLRQLVPGGAPPHAVTDDCVCPLHPGSGSLGSWQLRSPGSHTSAVCWPSPSVLVPPVINSPENRSDVHFDYYANKLPCFIGISILQLVSSAPWARNWIQCLTSVTRP